MEFRFSTFLPRPFVRRPNGQVSCHYCGRAASCRCSPWLLAQLSREAIPKPPPDSIFWLEGVGLGQYCYTYVGNKETHPDLWEALQIFEERRAKARLEQL